MTTRWPVRERVEAFWQGFLHAMQDGPHGELRDLLHPAYIERPSGVGRDELVAGARHDLAAFGALELIDFTAVGPVVTLDLTADWHTAVGGRHVEITDWPLRVQAIRNGADGSYRALRLAPYSRRDRGVILPDGSYRHDGLNVSLQTSGEEINRTQDALGEMQVMIGRELGEGDAAAHRRVVFRVLGYRARPGETDADAIAVWLTSGAVALRSGVVVSGGEQDTIGPPGAAITGRSQHWLFGDGGSTWARERWTFVSRGLRHFLVVLSAQAPSRREAEGLFESEEEWFDGLVRGVRIE
jgi:hypothetical protein